MPIRTCETCGGQEFDPFTWTCVTCKYKHKVFGMPAPECEAEEGEGLPGQSEAEGGLPDESPEQGEGKGEGQGNEPPPPVVFMLGDVIELEDGTCVLVVIRPNNAASTFNQELWYLTYVLRTGLIKMRLKSVTQEKESRRQTANVGPGDFLFEGPKQEIIAQLPEDLAILDNCAYTVVDLDTGEVKGLTQEDAEKATKLDG